MDSQVFRPDGSLTMRTVLVRERLCEGLGVVWRERTHLSSGVYYQWGSFPTGAPPPTPLLTPTHCSAHLHCQHTHTHTLTHSLTHKHTVNTTLHTWLYSPEAHTNIHLKCTCKHTHLAPQSCWLQTCLCPLSCGGLASLKICALTLRVHTLIQIQQQGFQFLPALIT